MPGKHKKYINMLNMVGVTCYLKEIESSDHIQYTSSFSWTVNRTMDKDCHIQYAPAFIME